MGALFAWQKRLELCAWLFITINTTTTHACPNWCSKADWLSMAHLFLSVFSSHVRMPRDAQSCLPCAWCEAVRIPLISLSLSLFHREMTPMPGTSAGTHAICHWRFVGHVTLSLGTFIRLSSSGARGNGHREALVYRQKLRVKKKID